MCDNVSIIVIIDALKSPMCLSLYIKKISFLDKYEFLRTTIIKIILLLRSIYNAYKTLFYHKIMSVTMATDNYFLEFYNGCSI